MPFRFLYPPHQTQAMNRNLLTESVWFIYYFRYEIARDSVRWPTQNPVVPIRERVCLVPSGITAISAYAHGLEQSGNELSISYLNAAIAYPSLTIYEKSILILLANHANYEGICWPSIPTLCNEGCITRGSAIKAIKGLEEKGILKVSRHHRQSNTYKLMIKTLESAPRTLPVRQSEKSGSSREPQPSVRTKKNPLGFSNKWLGEAPKGTKTPEEVSKLMADEKAALFRTL